MARGQKSETGAKRHVAGDASGRSKPAKPKNEKRGVVSAMKELFLGVIGKGSARRPAASGTRSRPSTGTKSDATPRRAAAGPKSTTARPGASTPTRAAKPGAARVSAARKAKGRPRPTEGAHASSGAAGSRKAVKKATQRRTSPTVRGAASSGSQRGTTLGPRKGTRSAAMPSAGTAKPGVRRGSAKSGHGRKRTASAQ